MILLVGSYIQPSEPRMSEYVEVLARNLENPYLDEIHLFIEDPLESYKAAIAAPGRPSLGRLSCILGHPKVKLQTPERRLLYQEYFDYANRQGPGKIFVLANSDIWFDKTLEYVALIDLDTTFVVLAKWEGNMMHSPPDSQDSWIFKTPVRPMLANWTLGIPGCENRIAFEAKKAGYTVLNPAWSIRTHHLHDSKVRTWRVEQRLPGDYWTVQASFLPGRAQDMPIYRAV